VQRRRQVSDADLDACFCILDTDASGELDLREFLAFVK
jgi:hypothetical protein